MADDVEIQLIRRAQSGDDRAFEVLVDRYQGVLYNLALRMTGNAEDARDVTQTAFLKVWRHLASYDPQHRFYSWVYRITLNESINFVQRRRPHAELDERLPSSGVAPDAAVHTNELGGHIEQALMELSPDYRQVLVLRHFQNLSYQEIGEILSVPEKTVKSRLYTARQQLGALLRRRGITSS